MARAQGARAQMALAFESVYGTPPGSGFTQMPFITSSLAGMRRLRPIEFQLAGFGDGMKRRAAGSSSGTTRRGPYAPSACCA
jgi:hypothetical protein